MKKQNQAPKPWSQPPLPPSPTSLSATPEGEAGLPERGVEARFEYVCTYCCLVHHVLQFPLRSDCQAGTTECARCGNLLMPVNEVAKLSIQAIDPEEIPNEAWRDVVRLAYAEGGDGARNIQAITSAYVRMRTELQMRRSELLLVRRWASRYKATLEDLMRLLEDVKSARAGDVLLDAPLRMAREALYGPGAPASVPLYHAPCNRLDCFVCHPIKSGGR